MNNKTFSLYKIVNTINEKVYIGITSDPARRWSQHKSKGSTCKKLSRAFAKYGVENFKMVILCQGLEDYILDLEVKAIELYDSVSSGYNIYSGSPKAGSVLIPDDVKKRISDSLVDYYSKNEQASKGRPINSRSDDKACFASGFWFPNSRTAITSLNINRKTFYYRRNAGTLGNVLQIPKDSVRYKPTYVGGFWFNTLLQASISLNKPVTTLIKRIKDGYVEQKGNKPGTVGLDNHMAGRTGSLHHNSKAVYVDGVLYGSIAEAARETNYTKKMIYLRLKNQVSGFFYKH